MKHPLILANEGSSVPLALENELSLDADGWALIAPFGAFPNRRTVRLANGTTKDESYLQVVDEAAVEAMRGGSFLGRVRRALFGLPVFRGHADLADHAPTNTQAKPNASRTPVGAVKELRRTDRGLEAQFVLLPAGFNALANEGLKWTSALWDVTPTGEIRDGATVVRPTRLLSVALTDRPNISSVDALANAKADAGQTNQQNEDPMKQLLIGWLAAQGVVLANDAADAAVLEAVQRHSTGVAGQVTTLANEKSGLATQVSTLTSECDALKTKLTEGDTALANERTALANERARFTAERKGRAEATVDLAITQLRLAPTQREAQITALANSADFDKDARALLAAAVNPAFRTAPQTNGERKAGADATASVREQCLALANEETEKLADKDWNKGWAAAKAKHPALFEQLTPKTA